MGLAAGMDKDGRAVLAWQALGFSFAELGTVTAEPQPGNDRPRVFRLRHSKALINRMGFNNTGAARLHHELSLLGVYRGNEGAGIPIGISIGKTRVVPVEDAIGDYLHLAGPGQPARRLRGDQRVQPEHPRTAQPAGRRRDCGSC